MEVFCLGTIAADFYINKSSLEYYVGGCSANVAINLANMGVNCNLISTLSKDKLGKYLTEKIKKSGVSLHTTMSENKTPIIFVEKDEEHNISYSAYIENTTYAELYPSIINETLKTKGKDCILVLNGTILHNIKIHDWLLPIITDFKKRGGLVVFDINWRDHIPQPFYIVLKNYLDISDIIKGTPYEFSLLSKMDINEYITQNFSKKICLLTKAEKGCTIFYKNMYKDLNSIKPDKIIDPSGCGDAFLAGFIKGFIDINNNKQDINSLVKCANIGNKLASQIISVNGSTLH